MNEETKREPKGAAYLMQLKKRLGDQIAQARETKAKAANPDIEKNQHHEFYSMLGRHLNEMDQFMKKHGHDSNPLFRSIAGDVKKHHAHLGKLIDKADF